MPTLITKKKKRTSVEYDSDGLIIPYHQKYGITRKKKVTDPFALPQACLRSPSAITHKNQMLIIHKVAMKMKTEILFSIWTI